MPQHLSASIFDGLPMLFRPGLQEDRTSSFLACRAKGATTPSPSTWASAWEVLVASGRSSSSSSTWNLAAAASACQPLQPATASLTRTSTSRGSRPTTNRTTTVFVAPGEVPVDFHPDTDMNLVTMQQQNDKIRHAKGQQTQNETGIWDTTSNKEAQELADRAEAAGDKVPSFTMEDDMGIQAEMEEEGAFPAAPASAAGGGGAQSSQPASAAPSSSGGTPAEGAAAAAGAGGGGGSSSGGSSGAPVSGSTAAGAGGTTIVGAGGGAAESPSSAVDQSTAADDYGIGEGGPEDETAYAGDSLQQTDPPPIRPRWALPEQKQSGPLMPDLSAYRGPKLQHRYEVDAGRLRNSAEGRKLLEQLGVSFDDVDAGSTGAAAGSGGAEADETGEHPAETHIDTPPWLLEGVDYVAMRKKFSGGEAAPDVELGGVSTNNNVPPEEQQEASVELNPDDAYLPPPPDEVASAGRGLPVSMGDEGFGFGITGLLKLNGWQDMSGEQDEQLSDADLVKSELIRRKKKHMENTWSAARMREEIRKKVVDYASGGAGQQGTGEEADQGPMIPRLGPAVE